MRGVLASDIRARDAQREEAIRDVLPIATVWECEINAQLRANKDMREFFAETVIKVNSTNCL